LDRRGKTQLKDQTRPEQIPQETIPIHQIHPDSTQEELTPQTHPRRHSVVRRDRRWGLQEELQCQSRIPSDLAERPSNRRLNPANRL
jgi:hypothetical protein